MDHPLDLTLVDVALGDRPADTVITGGRIVNVCSGEVHDGGIAIVSGRIASIGDVAAHVGPDTEVLDAEGSFLLPGFIDGHQHVEDSRMSITSFSDAVVPVGTTSIYTGFDHIAVVAGLPGVRAFLDEAAGLPLQVFWGSPFRLPYTDPPATVGFPYTGAQHAEAQRWPECIGVWELCPDFLQQRDPDTLEGLRLAAENRLGVYGSVPWADGRMDVVAAHVAAGLRVDHEAYSQDEIVDKLRLGLRILLRDSPVEHFLPPLVGLLVDRPELAAKVGFCTDQANAADVAANGHIDRLVRESIAAGIPPVTAIQMATINTATTYRVDHIVGSLTPGRRADVLFVDDLEDLRVDRVVAAGRLVAEAGELLAPTPTPERPAFLVGPFPRPRVAAEDLVVRVDPTWTSARVHTMVLTDNAFHRLGEKVELDVVDGVVQANPEADVAVLGYVERFGKAEGPPGVAFVSGFGLRHGAIASSCTPDDDNILVVGTDAADMALAVNTIIEAGGGDVAVVDGAVVAMVALPVGGIVSDLPPAELRVAQRALDDAVAAMGGAVSPPFMYLGVLGITAIPDYGMSEWGLVDAATHQVLDPVLGRVG